MFGAFALFAEGLFGEDGWLDSLAARRRHRLLVEDVRRLRAENRQLREEARRLRDDLDAIEEVARDELGLIAPGETIFYLTEPPGSDP